MSSVQQVCRPAGIHDNPEVAMLSNSLFRLLDRMIDLAATQRVWGLIPATPAKNLAFRLRVQNAYILERGLVKLVERGLVERTEEGALWVTLFGDSHPQTLSVAQPGDGEEPVSLLPDYELPLTDAERATMSRLRKRYLANGLAIPAELQAARGVAPASRNGQERNGHHGLERNGNSRTGQNVTSASRSAVLGRADIVTIDVTPVEESQASSSPEGVTTDVTPSYARESVSVKNVSNVSEEEENFILFGLRDVNTPNANAAEREDVTANVTPTGAVVTPAETTPTETTNTPAAKPDPSEPASSEEPAMKPCEVKITKELLAANLGEKQAIAALSQRGAAVRAVVALTGDDDHAGLFSERWSICCYYDLLPGWDKAFASLTRACAGPKSLPGETLADRERRGRYFVGTINNIIGNDLRRRGLYLPVGTPAERSQARAATDELKRQWAAQDEAERSDGPQEVPT